MLYMILSVSVMFGCLGELRELVMEDRIFRFWVISLKVKGYEKLLFFGGVWESF